MEPESASRLRGACLAFLDLFEGAPLACTFPRPPSGREKSPESPRVGSPHADTNRQPARRPVGPPPPARGRPRPRRGLPAGAAPVHGPPEVPGARPHLPDHPVHALERVRLGAECPRGPEAAG